MATERIFDTQQLHDMVQEAGIVSLLFHGSGSLIHSEDVNGLCQDDLERLLAIACRAYASRAAQQPVQEGVDALAAIKALQDRIDTLNSSLECEKRMRKDSDERMENAEAALKDARVQALEDAARLYDHEDVQAPVGNSAWGEAYQEGWIAGAQAYRDAIRLLGEDAGRGES